MFKIHSYVMENMHGFNIVTDKKYTLHIAQMIQKVIYWPTILISVSIYFCSM